MNDIRILVVEDIAVIREYICELIAVQNDMTVIASVGTGAEAEHICDRLPVDIILMDIEMESNTAGIDAAKKILNRYPGIKIIYLTAHETEETIIAAMATGAVDYLVKDADEKKIAEHIRQAMDGKTTLEPAIQSVVMHEYRRLHRSEQSLMFFIQNLNTLTPVERQLVKYLLQGYTAKGITKLRNVELVTVKTEIRGLLRKFGVRRTKEIVELVEQLNISYLF
jgi:DNA-binding NarL/FixJ family response regulator